MSCQSVSCSLLRVLRQTKHLPLSACLCLSAEKMSATGLTDEVAPCDLCAELLPRGAHAAHQAPDSSGDCPEVKVACPLGCSGARSGGPPLVRRTLGAHLRDNCPLQEVRCPRLGDACTLPRPLLRSEIESHLAIHDLMDADQDEAIAAMATAAVEPAARLRTGSPDLGRAAPPSRSGPGTAADAAAIVAARGCIDWRRERGGYDVFLRGVAAEYDASGNLQPWGWGDAQDIRGAYDYYDEAYRTHVFPPAALKLAVGFLFGMDAVRCNPAQALHYLGIATMARLPGSFYLAYSEDPTEKRQLRFLHHCEPQNLLLRWRHAIYTHADTGGDRKHLLGAVRRLLADDASDQEGRLEEEHAAAWAAEVKGQGTGAGAGAAKVLSDVQAEGYLQARRDVRAIRSVVQLHVAQEIYHTGRSRADFWRSDDVQELLTLLCVPMCQRMSAAQKLFSEIDAVVDQLGGWGRMGGGDDKQG